MMPTGKKEAARQDGTEPQYLNFCSLSREEMIRLAAGTPEDRKKSLVPVSQVKAENVLKQEPMSFVEELATILFLTVGVPNGAFSLPLITFLIGKFVVGDVGAAFKVLGLLLLPLIFLPQKFNQSSLHSWIAVQVIKYFSFRVVAVESPQQKEACTEDGGKGRPQIFVAPPHGVFPYGNVLAMLAWPTFTGHHFQGLTANSALRVPIFKQILGSIGCIDASRSSARRALENYPYSVGISTGGVREVFETTAGDECIVLKERVGLIKLAIRTGADLVPCYLFGNTKLLSCWGGDGIPLARAFLENLSRKIGFALIIIYGRFGLPIPRRMPVLAVHGKAIPTVHMQCEEPTTEQVLKVQGQLLADMQELFDKHKHLYGWDDKRLVIK